MELKSPLRLRIHITYACNLSCSFCYNPYHDPKEMMSWEDFKLVADLAVEKDIFQVSIGGGEPLLHPNFINMYKYIAEKSFAPPIILTNGTVWNESSLKEIIKLKEYGKPRFHVSLDSLKPMPGMHDYSDKAIRFIDRIIKEDFNVVIGTVIGKDNIEDVPKIVEKFGKTVEYNFMSIMFLEHNREWAIKNLPSPEQIKKLSERVKSLGLHHDFDNIFTFKECDTFKYSGSSKCIGCSAAYMQLVVHVNLDVIACEIIPDVILGNLRENSFDEIWFGKIANRVRNETTPICHDRDLVHSLSSLYQRV